MTRQTIRVAAVKRACRWCAFVALCLASGKTSEADRKWLRARHDYQFALAGH